jgi:hypothetical protein
MGNPAAGCGTGLADNREGGQQTAVWRYSIPVRRMDRKNHNDHSGRMLKQLAVYTDPTLVFPKSVCFNLISSNAFGRTKVVLV